MKIKEGVVLAGLSVKMRPVFLKAERLWKDYGQELVITEGTGGLHSVGSLHYYGYAVDLRNRNFTEKDKKKIVVELKTQLGTGYDVILHRTHIHVEYDNAKLIGV